MRKRISLSFSVCPVNVVSHFVIDNIDPLPFRIIFPTSFPIFWMDKVDTAILIGLSRSFPPVKILKPLYAGALQAIKLAQERHGATKVESPIGLEKIGKISVYNSAFLHRRKEHTHKDSLLREIVGESCQKNTGIQASIFLIDAGV